MDVIIVFHGLGNQMSQYAFYLQKRSINKSTYYVSFGNHHNGLELNKAFNINWKETVFQRVLFVLFRVLLAEKVKIITRPLQWILNLLNFRIIKEGYDYNFKKNFLSPSKGVTFYLGGWHSEKYFLAIKDKVFKEFEFCEVNDLENANHVESISKNNSVSIHVRRGDYLNADNINLFGDVCNRAYFEKAINLIETKINNPHFYVFSNDIPWVKTNLSMNNVTFVTCNTGKNSWKDMYLMSLCKHNIIANSTFSWWAASLNKKPDKIVIAPSRFLKSDIFSNIYLDSWIKLSDY